jgi:hypothetical protein
VGADQLNPCPQCGKPLKLYCSDIGVSVMCRWCGTNKSYDNLIAAVAAHITHPAEAALRAEVARLKTHIHSMRTASTHPIITVDNNGFVLSSNGDSIFLSQEQAMALTENLIDELEVDAYPPEACQVVRTLRAEVDAIPYVALATVRFLHPSTTDSYLQACHIVDAWLNTHKTKETD